MKKINCLQYCSMLTLLLISCFMGFGVYSIVKAAGIDAYISILVSGLVGIPLVFLFIYINSYEPAIPLKDKLIKLYGKNIGGFFNYLIVILIFIIGINIMFNLNNFIVSQFLPETPIYIIGLSFATVIIYLNSKGIETISRVALILLFLNLILFLIAGISLVPKVSIDNLKPFLENGIGRTFNGIIYFLIFNILPIFMLLIVPRKSIKENKHLNKYIGSSYIVSILIIFLVFFVTLGILGIYLTSIYQYPEYIVLKHINFFNFLDRIENIITAQWIFGLFFTITFVVYFITNSIKYNNKSTMFTSLITILLLFFSIILFKNNTIFNTYIYKFIPFIGIFFLIIMIIIGITIALKNRFK